VIAAVVVPPQLLVGQELFVLEDYTAG